jgi:acid phosphatase (class A)
MKNAHVKPLRVTALSSLLLSLSLSVAAMAAEPAPATADFVAPDAVDYRSVIAVPPAEDSITAQADFEVAHLLHANRTPENIALARRYEHFSAFTMLTTVFGDACTPEALPQTAAFFKQAYAESRPVLLAAKYDWKRARPYARDPSLEPAMTKMPPNTSYPSGHSYESAWTAALLTAAFPEHDSVWAEHARLARWSRLYAGMHYPTDVVAGRLLGEAVGQAMLHSQKTRDALDAVRAEILAKFPAIAR